MHLLADNAELGPLLAAGFVFPAIELQAALNVDRLPLAAVFAGNLSQATPEGDVDVRNLLLALLADLVGAVHGNAEIRDGASFWGVLDFGITGDVPDDHHFVEVGHRMGGAGS